jgi:hypothetical protein
MTSRHASTCLAIETCAIAWRAAITPRCALPGSYAVRCQQASRQLLDQHSRCPAKPAAARLAVSAWAMCPSTAGSRSPQPHSSVLVLLHPIAAASASRPPAPHGGSSLLLQRRVASCGAPWQCRLIDHAQNPAGSALLLRLCQLECHVCVRKHRPHECCVFCWVRW